MNNLRRVKIEINTVLRDFIKERVPDCQILWNSLLKEENVKEELSCYVHDEIISEYQDTLSVDVGDLGKRRFESKGIYVLTFFVPRFMGNGYNLVEDMVQDLKNILRVRNFETCWVRGVQTSNLFSSKDERKFHLSFEFIFNEII